MAKGRFILIRHGETDANRRRCFADSDEIPLSDIGIQQAREVALLLASGCRAQILVSSHFLRARQTGEIIAEALRLATEAIPGLHERDFGCLKGHAYERMGELMGSNDREPWRWKPEGGESLDDVRRRAILVMESLRARYPGREIVVVCHGAVIQAICAHITGVWTEASVPPNCGIVTIDYEEDVWGEPVLSGAWNPIAHSAR
ncbi:MAG TPA: histidine phosphatase family protein [Bryobacteraceae bacterium]|nr:histidine phosphatase family protein [Bryobacteraceae bacterium]